MNNLKKQKPPIIKETLKNMLLEVVGNIQYGSVTIIKQDDTVIQINVNEKIYLI